MRDDACERCQSSSNPPSIRVIEALAETLSTDPLDLEPVSRYLDLEALDALFESGSANPEHVCFDYDGYTVCVYGDGSVEVSHV